MILCVGCCGIFYVYPNENGEYIKIADITEGHSVRILGDDIGTMSVSIQTSDGAMLSNAFAAQNVPVEKDMVATISQNSDQSFTLEMDYDGNGISDEKIPMLIVEEPSRNDTEELKGSEHIWGKVAIGGIVCIVIVGITCLIRKQKRKAAKHNTDRTTN